MFQESPENKTKLDEIYSMLPQLFKDSKIEVPPKEQVLDILAKLSLNAFNIYIIQREEVVVGEGLYLETSVFDHSCQPNAEYSFKHGDMVVMCTQDGIDFSEVRISYVNDICLLPSERRALLLEKYFFDCGCDRCVNHFEREEALGKASIKCPRPVCKGGIPANVENKQAPVTCIHCNKVISSTKVMSYWKERDKQLEAPKRPQAKLCRKRACGCQLFFPADRLLLKSLLLNFRNTPKV